MVSDHSDVVHEAAETVERGEPIGVGLAHGLSRVPDREVEQLTRLADRARRRCSENRVDLCAIISARSGRCSEDCSFCAQSDHHDGAAPVFGMKSVTEIVEAAVKAEEQGARRFCTVTSGDELGDEDFSTVLEAVAAIKERTDLGRCASVGSLDGARARQLKEAGLDRYHHNLETARSHFGAVCSTHSYEDRLATIGCLDGAGIEKCVGGILNLGETPAQRIQFAFELAAINPVSVPINFLNPRRGTPLEHQEMIKASEAAKYLAIFKLVLPASSLRLAGGRAETFVNDQAMPFRAGVSALLIGDLLTTQGPDVDQDLALLGSLGFDH
ncbi:MAG: biotin synthase BioB [Terriglobia bacterium]